MFLQKEYLICMKEEDIPLPLAIETHDSQNMLQDYRDAIAVPAYYKAMAPSIRHHLI